MHPVVEKLFQEIEHGDEKHRAWLREKLEDWSRRMFTDSSAVAYGRELGALLVRREMSGHTNDAEEAAAEVLSDLHDAFSDEEKAAIGRASDSFSGKEAARVLRALVVALAADDGTEKRENDLSAAIKRAEIFLGLRRWDGSLAEKKS